jgi:hypothetical protein
VAVLLTFLLVLIGFGWHVCFPLVLRRIRRPVKRPPLDQLLAAAELDVLRALERKLSANPLDPKLKSVRERVRRLEIQRAV